MRSLFLDSLLQRTRLDALRLTWLFGLWHADPDEHSLFAAHLVTHHHLFSRYQHCFRLTDYRPGVWVYLVFSPNTEQQWEELRRACCLGPNTCMDPALRYQTLMAESRYFENTAREILGALEENLALPHDQQLPSRGMEVLEIQMRLLLADTQNELANLVFGEDEVAALIVARQAYDSALRCASAHYHWSSWKHGQLGYMLVERQLLRIGSLIGGTSTLRVTCQAIESLLRRQQRQEIKDLADGSNIYAILRTLRSKEKYHDIHAVYMTGRECALIASDPLEAFWWQQKGKAELTSAVMAERRTRDRLIAWLDGDRRGRREIPWQLVVGQLLHYIKTVTHGPHIKGSRTLGLGTTSVVARTSFDHQSFVNMFTPSSVARLSSFCGSAQRRIVWVDWMEDTEQDEYQVTFARFGQTPIHLSICHPTPSALKHWLERYWTSKKSTLGHFEAMSVLHELDGLVQPLQTLLKADDELILCPTGILHTIPLHVLYLDRDGPLSERHCVIYASSLATYVSSVLRSEVADSSTPTSSGPAIAAIYRPQPGKRVPEDFDRVQAQLRTKLSNLANEFSTTFHWDSEVSVQTFKDLLQTRRALLFCGHCSATPTAWYDDADPWLVLLDGTSYFQYAVS